MNGSFNLAEKEVSHYLVTGSHGRTISLSSGFVISGEDFIAQLKPDIYKKASFNKNNKLMRMHDDYPAGECDTHTGSKPEVKYTAHTSSSHNHHQHHHHTPGKQPNNNKNITNVQSSGTHNNISVNDNKIYSSVASNGKQGTSTPKDKEQVQKSAIRVCGDWSEHISSSGKRYYYNCKTEVSQWEKPKEWNSELCKTPDHRTKNVRPRMLSSSHANKISADNRASRHSSSSDHHGPTTHHQTDSVDMRPENCHGKPRSLSFTNQHNRESRESWSDQQLSMEFNDDINTLEENVHLHKSEAESNRLIDSVSTNFHQHHHQVASQHSSSMSHNNGFNELKHTDNKHPHHDGQHPSHLNHKSLSRDVLQRTLSESQSSQKYDIDHRPVEDMDISSSSPSSSSLPSSANSPLQLLSSSTPVGVTTSSASTSNNIVLTGHPIATIVNRQPVIEGANYDKTIQTLQELQKVLSRHIKAQQNTTITRPPTSQSQASHSIPLSGHQEITSYNLTYHSGQGNTCMVPGSNAAVQHQPFTGAQNQGLAPIRVVPLTQREEDVDRTSPASVSSSTSSCGSPTISDSNSQNITLTSQTLTTAAIKRDEPIKLTESHSNYYNESLIGHVLGWQADIVEKQAAKLWEESMLAGSEQCNKISVQLKRARSDVRIAEIQCTLHEQRIMSSDQQYQEIENLKISYSFLPS